jgi:hypothetical protein
MAVTEVAAVVSQHLLHLVSHLARLATEAEGGIENVCTPIGIKGRAAGPVLIIV